MASLRISPEAVRDIESIRDYIQEDNPEAADRVEQELVDAIRQLAEWPGKGHIRLELASSDVHFWPVRSYLIIYRVRHAEVGIIRVLHGAQDIASILGSKI